MTPWLQQVKQYKSDLICVWYLLHSLNRVINLLVVYSYSRTLVRLKATFTFSFSRLVHMWWLAVECVSFSFSYNLPLHSETQCRIKRSSAQRPSSGLTWGGWQSQRFLHTKSFLCYSYLICHDAGGMELSVCHIKHHQKPNSTANLEDK